MTGVAAIRSAESPAGIVWSADRPEHLVDAEPDDAEQREPERCRRAASGSCPRASAGGRAATGTPAT